MTTFDLSAVGFLVLDTLCSPADELPPTGGATFVDQMLMTVAGTAGATAFDCALLGLDVRMVSELGQDPMGDWLLSEMRRVGIDISMVSRNADVQSAMSMLPIGTDGERRAFFVPGTAETFNLPREEMERACCDARMVHLGGTGLLRAFDGGPSLDLLRCAKALGCTTVFDLILADDDTARLVEPLLPHIDYFVPSIEEARTLTGCANPGDVSAWFKSRGVGNVLLTLGGDGVWVDPADGEEFMLPAHAVDVVDTTGCGDSFTAGVITGLINGWDIQESARFATTVAAHVAIGLGSQGALRDIESTLSAMSAWPVKAVSTTGPVSRTK